MLRSNSAKARANLRAYIMNHFDSSNYTDEAPEGWDAIARFIMETFEEEKAHERGNRHDVFVSWTQGLPSVLDTCYWYNRPAVNDLGAILEETDAEMQMFDEHAACLKLSRMIYMELQRGCK